MLSVTLTYNCLIMRQSRCRAVTLDPVTACGQVCLLLQVELDKRGVVLPKSLMVNVSKNEIAMMSLNSHKWVVLQPLDNEEHTIFRFLKARKMNVEAAADMLQSKLLQPKPSR